MKKLSCFVIMPFSKTQFTLNGSEREIEAEEWLYIYENWIKKAVESYGGITCNRSPLKPGNFVKGIVNDIANSDITIADLTGGKPNVYYELGIRHALKNGTIIISQAFDNLPTDLKSYHCFEYHYLNEAHKYQEMYSKFERNIHKYISSIIEDDYSSDNPVADFLEDHDKKTKQKEKPIDSVSPDLEKNKIFGDEVVLIRDYDAGQRVLQVDEIEFIAAERAYSEIHTIHGERLLLTKSLNSILKEIRSKSIVRVHRSYAVNIKKVTKIKGNIFVIGKHEIPISESYKNTLGM